MICPKCGLVNPSSAQICDCGYSFETGQQGVPLEGSGGTRDSEAQAPHLVGIRGWLVLPAAGLILSLLLGVAVVIGSWLALLAELQNTRFDFAVLMVFALQLGLLIFTIYTSTLFFRKKRETPSTIIRLIITTFLANAWILAYLAAGNELDFDVRMGAKLVIQWIAALVWIAYFKESKRVKTTFVN